MNAQKHLLREKVSREVVVIRFFHVQRVNRHGVCESVALSIEGGSIKIRGQEIDRTSNVGNILLDGIFLFYQHSITVRT